MRDREVVNGVSRREATGKPTHTSFLTVSNHLTSLQHTQRGNTSTCKGDEMDG